MVVWIKKHTKGITIGALLAIAPIVYGGIRWQLMVTTAVAETLPKTVEVLNDNTRQIIRLETENDGFREEIRAIREDYEKIDDLEVMVRALYIHITGDEPPVRRE